MKVIISLILLSLYFSACQSQTSKNYNLTHFSQNMMTIDYHISIAGQLTPSQKKIAEKIIAMTFQEVDERYNKWNPFSEISQINALTAHTTQTLSPELFAFLKKIDRYVSLSEGKFDPTIEPLQELWKNKAKTGQIPTKEEISEISHSIGWNKIHFDNGVFFKDHDQTQMDFGGIAKGLCIDLLLERLTQAGFYHLFVEWGGDIRAQGLHPSGRPWKVAISHPNHSFQKIAEIDLINRSIATSGDYFQYWSTDNQKTFCHIFHPLTLRPVEIKPGSIASASLLAADCVTADALAKVLMLFDSAEEAQEWVKKIQLDLPEIACWIVTR